MLATGSNQQVTQMAEKWWEHPTCIQKAVGSSPDWNSEFFWGSDFALLEKEDNKATILLVIRFEKDLVDFGRDGQ